MEVFWIVVGVVAVIIFIISQNRTKTSNRTVIRQEKTIKTDDGEIKIQRTQVVDSTTTQYHRADNAPDVSANPKYDQSVIEAYSRKPIEAVKEISPSQPQPFTSALPSGVSQRPAYHGNFPGDNKPTPTPTPTPTEDKTSSNGKKQCTRCRINLPYDKFRRSSKNPDGLTIWCASCLDGPKNTRHTKWCPICNVRRKRTSFYSNAQNADGLMAWCKTCWDKHKGKR
ncbi:hypothetical protein GF718_09025 [Citrobacter braakii]|uniref:hypothetical protein n=1 Tax=Citrobacter braakii TaxID=57706 RepID=UPI00193DB6A7|nr:hypothetical protein [Citrobacter braakii]MBM3061465.1 hypothetical protein [Citrobacter braakii]MBM3068961.1 hypothetical protein [Citrobacter braakii]